MAVETHETQALGPLRLGVHWPRAVCTRAVTAHATLISHPGPWRLELQQHTPRGAKLWASFQLPSPTGLSTSVDQKLDPDQ